MNDTVTAHQAVGGATQRGKPDPNVRLPPAVKAAADRAEALSNQAREAAVAAAANGGDQPISATQRPPEQRQPPQGVTMANFDPRNPNPPTDVPGAPPRDTKPRHVSPVPNVPQPQPPPQPQPQPQQLQFTPPPAPQAPQPQEGDWEHQFKSLKGRYDAETENNRRLSRQVTDMQRLMATLNTPPQAVGGPAPVEGSGVRFSSPIAGGGNWQARRLVTDQERTEFGPDLVDVMGRRAQEVVEPLLAQVYGELQQVKRQIGGVQNTVQFDARVKMYDDLGKEIPNWSEINTSPEFEHWLNQVDPISRRTRRSFLDAAHNSNITGQVVDIFRGFLADQAAFGPAGGQAQPGNGAGGYSQSNPAASTPQAFLTQFAAPGRAKSGQTEVPPEKPIFTRADITQFYRDKTAGRYAGREQEANAIEAQLFQAGNEGRIR